MRSPRLLPRVAVCCILVSFAAAQISSPEHEPAGEFHGRVIAAGTGGPLPGVMVTLRDHSGQLAGLQSSTVTGDGGSFKFTGLSKGFHTFYCFKPGYDPQRDPTYQGYLGPDEVVRDLVIELRPPGAITGVIRDPEGRPIPDVNVIAERTYELFQDVDLRESQRAISDDQGRYRITGLPVGRYFVRAIPSDLSAEPLYSGTYYPGTLDLSAASRVRIEWGGEAAGIDFRLQPARQTLVRGKLINGLSGVPCDLCEIVVVQLEGEYARRVERREPARTTPDGRFEIRGLVPGAYILLAKLEEPYAHARTEIQVVSERPTEATLTLLPGVEVSGAVRLATKIPDASERAKAASPSVRLWPPDRWTLQRDAESAPDQDGRFTLTGVAPGRYKIHSNCGVEDAYLISAAVSGRELSGPYLNVSAGAPIKDLDLVCGLGDGTIDLTIKPSVQADPFDRLPGVSVLYRPAADGSRYLSPGNFGVSGSGRLSGVNLSFRPGRYKFYAISDLLELEWSDPEVERVLAPYAVEVDLNAGERTEVELVFVPSSIRLP